MTRSFVRWSNLFVIFRHEVRDQIRDRRTLFMIFVMPILLYPILGIGAFQFATLLEQKPLVVVVVGAEYLPKAPPLLNPTRDGFNPALFDSPAEAGRVVVRPEPASSPMGDPRSSEQAIRNGRAQAVMVIPRELPEQLLGEKEIDIPIRYNSVDESSKNTQLRISEILSRWRQSIVAGRLRRDLKTQSYTEPIQVKAQDVATRTEVGGSLWSRIFPFLLVMMSLTGAFYPAIDLCAGEKERGTMETLLISPASRSEIVLGKFLTVMLASVVTAFLNLLSMGLTGIQLAHQVGVLAADGSRRSAASILAPPTLQAAFWMVVLLIPLAAFFSAVCLSLAVLARSMKEGQYYMTPLYLICMPLIFLTLMPGIELNLFYSLVPITGVALLLRALILGNYHVASQFFLPVLVPTLIYAAVALRWAIDQFQREDVLFREAEQFSLHSWFRHLVRDREPMPTGGQATLCFALILTLSWFLIQFLLPQVGLTLSAVIAGQLVILIPPVIMAILLTSAPRNTLRLTWPEPRYLVLAVALVVALNPLVNELRPLVESLFPIPSLIKLTLDQVMSQSPGLAVSVLVFALVPAVCEEFAFRGFILSGLEHQHRTRSAILLSALLFGFLHVLLSLFQQLFNATLLGVVLGLLAVRSRSILPGIVFHFLNNALAVSLGSLVNDPRAASIVPWIYRDPAAGLYHVQWIVASELFSVLLLFHLWNLRFERPGRLASSRAGPVEPAF
ncbi:MAG: ABC transporter permease subunit/CPBP intramembrane protease [Isosphaerales bacterium]